MSNLYVGLTLGMFAIGTLFIARVITGEALFLLNKFQRTRRLRVYRESKANQFDIMDLPLLKSLKEAMDIIEIKVSPMTIVAFCVMFFFLGYFGVKYALVLVQLYIGLNGVVGGEVLNLIVGILVAVLPLFYIYFKLQSKRRDMAEVMIPLIQNFLGGYNPKDNIAKIINKSIPSTPNQIKREWTLLSSEISTGVPFEDAVYSFAKRVGNEWAEDFADILIVKQKYVSDVHSALFKLVEDMQKSFNNEQKRQSTLLAYRWGTIFFVFMAVAVIGFNIWIEPSNFKYYFQTDQGITIVSICFSIQFISMLVVLLTGRKRI